MNLTQIRVFEAVMTSASLSDAAHKLGRTQPAVSAAIRGLEEQLGLRLFHREGRKLVPVPEARYLLIEAQAILAQLAQVRQTMQSLVDGNAGRLTLASMPGPVAMLFPRFIAMQIAGNTDVNVSIMARTSTQIAELARAQNIDFGFADAPTDNDSASLYSADLITANCFIAVPRKHRLAKKRIVLLSDLSGEAMGTLPANHAHCRDLAERFESLGLEFHPTVESQTFLAVLQFVAAGQCCAVLDPLTVVHIDKSGVLSEEIAVLPLKEAISYRYALYAPNHRPISLLADRLRHAWMQEVLDLLDAREAEPRVQFAEKASDKTS